MSLQNAPTLLGWLYESGGVELSGREIHNGEDILIGRDSKSCQFIVNEPTISNRHLRIYSIIYEANSDPIQGFVYAEDLSTNGSYWQYMRDSHWSEAHIGKENAVLLSDGDQIWLCDGSCFVFRSALPARPINDVDGTGSHEEMQRKSFVNFYTITDRELGAGAFGKVQMAIDRLNQRQVACKIVNLKKPTLMWGQQKDFAFRLWQEVNLLTDISHPNIIHIERVFYTENTIYIIEDLITGGDLMSYIDRKGHSTITDEEACMIIYQILRALEYLHGIGIAHRDLKPDNVLLSKTGASARVILADFGQSKNCSRSRTGLSRRMKTLCGTLDFVAPEVHGRNPLIAKGRGYTIAADMWSLGALTTALYLGRSFFVADPESSDSAVLVNAAKCDLGELDHSPFWQNVDYRSRDFIKKLLTLDEKSRLDVGQALEHEWFTACGRRLVLEEKYCQLIKGWIPRRVLIDFKEDLDASLDARRVMNDSQLMPPPPRPCARSQLLRQAAPNGQTSPYFSNENKDLDRTATRGKEGGTSQSRNNWNKGQSIWPSKETIPSISHHKSTSSAHGPTPELATPPVQLLFKQSVQSVESGGFDIVRSEAETMPTEECRENSLSDDEEEKRIRAEASMEKRGFRSAKSLERSIVKRRKLKG